MPLGQQSTGCAFKSENDMSQGIAMQRQPQTNLANNLNSSKLRCEGNKHRGDVAGQVRNGGAGSSAQPTHHAALQCSVGDSNESSAQVGLKNLSLEHVFCLAALWKGNSHKERRTWDRNHAPSTSWCKRLRLHHSYKHKEL